MSMSFSQACASARKTSPPMVTVIRSGTVPRKQRELSSLLKAQPKRRRCIRLRPQTSEERAQTAAYWARWAERETRVLEMIRKRKVAALAAVTAR